MRQMRSGDETRLSHYSSIVKYDYALHKHCIVLQMCG